MTLRQLHERRSLAAARGFTLVEIMVVIVIIGVLAALIVPRIMDRPDQARVVAARQGINTIVEQLKMYKLDNRAYPTAEQGLMALVEKPSIEPVPVAWRKYLDKLPTDPWGHPYQYLNPGVHGDVDVCSFGADNQPGGEGVSADICSSD